MIRVQRNGDDVRKLRTYGCRIQDTQSYRGEKRRSDSCKDKDSEAVIQVHREYDDDQFGMVRGDGEMSVEVHIPSGLREYCRCPAEVQVTATTVGAALKELQREYASLYICVCDETGSVRKHVNLFVNSDMVPVRRDNGFETPLHSGDVLTIWQAVSGG